MLKHRWLAILTPGMPDLQGAWVLPDETILVCCHKKDRLFLSFRLSFRRVLYIIPVFLCLTHTHSFSRRLPLPPKDARSDDSCERTGSGRGRRLLCGVRVTARGASAVGRAVYGRRHGYYYYYASQPIPPAPATAATAAGHVLRQDGRVRA